MLIKPSTASDAAVFHVRRETWVRPRISMIVQLMLAWQRMSTPLLQAAHTTITPLAWQRMSMDENLRATQDRPTRGYI